MDAHSVRWHRLLYVLLEVRLLRDAGEFTVGTDATGVPHARGVGMNGPVAPVVCVAVAGGGFVWYVRDCMRLCASTGTAAGRGAVAVTTVVAGCYPVIWRG